MTIGPPIPEIQLDLENSRSKIKVKSTPVSAVSSWLISLVLHIRASYRLLPFRSMTIGPPIPMIQFDHKNSRSKVKVKGTPVSAASSWLISLVFHIRASYRLLYLTFHDNWASHSRDTIWPSKFKVKGQGQSYPSQRSIQLSHFFFCFTSFAPTIPKIWQIECSTGENGFKILHKKIAKKQVWGIIFPKLKNWKAWWGGYTHRFF